MTTAEELAILAADAEFPALVESYLAPGVDFMRSRLKARGDSRRLEAINQAELHRRNSKKLPQFTACRATLFPTDLSAEQSTSEALALFHASLIEPGSRVVDMTAGLGIDAMAVARRAASVTAVERQPLVAAALAHNARQLGFEHVEAVCADSIEWLDGDDSRLFDVIFIDPARRGAQGERLYSLADCAPDVTSLLPLMSRHARRLIVKASPMLDVTDTLRRLPGATDIYAVGTTTECKELVVSVALFVKALSFSEGSGPSARLHAVTIHGDGTVAEVTPEAASGCVPAIAGALEQAQWIAEPYPAVMKIGNPAWLTATYQGLQQIAPSTHLYVSATEPQPDFPGRVYRVALVTGYGRRDSAAIAAAAPTVNITARNFPDAPAQIARRLKLKEGGSRRLFAVRDSAGRPRLLLTE